MRGRPLHILGLCSDATGIVEKAAHQVSGYPDNRFPR
jgi:hypothetical protein